jgi:hypothetical protein
VVTEQLAYQAFVGLPENFIQEGTAYAFIDGVKEQEMKHHLLKDDKRSVKEFLSHSPNLEAGMEAARGRMQEVRAGVSTET